MTETESKKIPEAQLFLSSNCPHCPLVLTALSELVKGGRVGRLEVVNVEARPELASRLGVRSVPWVRIGPFELEGLRSQRELEKWIDRADTADGMAEYFRDLLSNGQLQKAVDLLSREPAQFEVLIRLLADPATTLTVHIGIGAVMESFEGSKLLAGLTRKLGELTDHHDARVRTDACHYLGLTREPEALPLVQRLLDDPDPDVRASAEESVRELSQVRKD